MIKILKSYLGIPLTAIIIGTLVFIFPKVIYDNIKFYKETGEHIKHSLENKNSK